MHAGKLFNAMIKHCGTLLTEANNLWLPQSIFIADIRTMSAEKQTSNLIVDKCCKGLCLFIQCNFVYISPL